MNKRRLLSIGVYFLGAFGLTFLFSQLPKLMLGGIDVKDILCGWGPLLSGLICYKVFSVPNQHKISLSGAKPYLTWSLVFLALLLPFLTSYTVSKRTILISVASQFIYSFGEEFGWRHYLQNATYGLKPWGRYVLIGCLWFLWHYSFTDDPVRAMAGQPIPPSIGIPVSIGMLSLFSFIWGDLVIKTRSILLPTVAHYLPKAGGTIALGIVVSLLILVQVGWKQLNRSLTTPSL